MTPTDDPARPAAAETTNPFLRIARERPKVTAGLAAAVGLGLVLGVVARPRLAEPFEEKPMAPVGQLAIEMAEVKPPPIPEGGEPLTVLPADLAAAAPVAPPPPALQPTAAPDPEPEPRRVAEAPPVAPVAPEPPQARAPVVRASAPIAPSYDCDLARTRAERMVCEDPHLALQDRRLDRAFRRAVDAGVPYGALRAEQDDWLAIREDAAGYDAGAVSDVYAQRIDELNAMARRDGPPRRFGWRD